uniref:(northern house mosquito) hypothetical protein n=1 Tax=Culex pipiens TaxID=7175 RepID=A0A8D8F9P1_CULPI
MNYKITLFLLLALVPVIFSQQVPLGCVEIRNFKIDRFLVKSRRDNNQRRHVSYAEVAQQWIIEKQGDHYKISHAETKEPLYETDGKYVYTLLARTDQGTMDDWIITPSGKRGCFYIKNVKTQHCLYTNGILNWVNAYGDCQGETYEWQIHQFKCKHPAEILKK